MLSPLALGGFGARGVCRGRLMKELELVALRTEVEQHNQQVRIVD